MSATSTGGPGAFAFDPTHVTFDVVGRISAEMICPYPPGIPVTAPGERLTEAVVEYLQQLAAAGVMVQGAADETLEHFRVAV